MKKDLLILSIGILLGLTISYFTFNLATKNSHSITSSTSSPKKNLNNSLEKAKQSKVVAFSTKNIHQKIPSRDDSETSTTTQEIKIDTLRSQLVSQIQSLPNNKIKWVKEIIDKFDKLPVEKQFEIEARDPDSAIAMEDKLRYDFYEQNATNGEGNIDSLECRTRYCKARISMPKDETMVLLKKLDHAFPGIILQSYNKDTQDDQYLIYIDIYIDLQSYKMWTQFEEIKKP